MREEKQNYNKKQNHDQKQNHNAMKEKWNSVREGERCVKMEVWYTFSRLGFRIFKRQTKMTSIVVFMPNHRLNGSISNSRVYHE